MLVIDPIADLIPRVAGAEAQLLINGSSRMQTLKLSEKSFRLGLPAAI